MRKMQLLKNQGHRNFKVNNCGLFLYRENSFLGALPDGILQCSCHSEKRLLEVKCPFSERETLNIDKALIILLKNKKVISHSGRAFQQLVKN